MENNKTPAIIAGVIAVLVIAGGALWFVNNNNEDSSSTTNQTQQTQEQEQAETPSVTIVTLASETSDLSTLVTAVKAAGLVETLQGEGPFTVLAPTNSAFEALPAGTLDSLLKTENKDQLASILKYHVISGKVLAQDLKDGQVVKTVQGGNLTVAIEGEKVYFVDAKGNKAMVEKADVNADNGVVHIINGVLLPS